MIKLTGKTLLFTDIHFGLKNNSVRKLNICVNVMKEIIKKVRKDKIENVIFGGDLFHNRINLSVDTINIVIKCITALSKTCNLYLIVGNHDTYNKTSVEVNSLNIFRDNTHVTIIEKPTNILINGKNTLLCPWLSDLTVYEPETFDIIIGHFDISMRYLIASYIEEHSDSGKTNENIINSFIEKDSFLVNNSSEEITNKELETIKNTKKSSELIGSFIDIVKPKGIIFSGHIHQHKEFIAKHRNFIFIGSPYQQTMGDIKNICGYYILNEDNSYEFFEIKNSPKHVELKMSEIVKNFENFNFEIVKNNIIQKIYDIEIDRVLDSKITHKILDYGPYEELIPKFEIIIDENNTEIISDESAEMIKKTKLEYIRNYIDNIDHKVLEEQDISPKILFDYMSEYYKNILDK